MEIPDKSKIWLRAFDYCTYNIPEKIIDLYKLTLKYITYILRGNRMELNNNMKDITGDPKKAVKKLAYPIIISMLLIMSNNLIDSIGLLD